MAEAEEFSYLQNLPCEIIEVIVCNDCLTIKDVLNLSATCRQLHETVSSQNIWKVKFQSTWPKGIACLSKDSNVFNDWFESCKYRQILDKRVVKFLEDLTEILFRRNITLSTSDFNAIVAIASENGSLSMNNVLDCLDDIYLKSDQVVSDSPFPLKGVYTLTNRFYAKAAIEHLKHRQLEEQWQKLGSTYTAPEIIANFFEQWIDTSSEYLLADTEIKIQELSDHIRSQLDKSHPLHKVPLSEQHCWVTQELTNNQWSPTVCRDLLKYISDILFRCLSFGIISGPTEDTFFIDRVLRNRTGHVVIMTVIYEAIARRFGVRCNIVCFSTHLFITWTDSQELNSPVYYVDIETGTLRGSRGLCPYSNASTQRESYRKYSPDALLAFMNNQYQCAGREERTVRRNEVSCTELLSIVYPTNPDCLLNLAETYENHYQYVDAAYNKLAILYEKDTTLEVLRRHPVLNYLEAKLSTHDVMGKRKVIPKHHPSAVSYTIGMICFHMEYQYTCLVRSWDLTCLASNEWQERMQVDRLSRGARQPFYHCVAEDGTERYVAQENLTAVVPNRKRLTAIEDIISSQFSHFDGFCYIPNSQINEEYPDEGKLRLFYKEKLGFFSRFGN